MLNSKLQKIELKPQNPSLKTVADIQDMDCELISNSQDVKPVLELLESDENYDNLFILNNQDVYGVEGVPYLYKNIWFVGNVDDII